MRATTSFTIRFDRFLLPSSVLRQSICVQADLRPVASAADCPGAVFFEPTYDPTRREVTYRQSANDVRLTPNTKYQITVFPPLDEASVTGFRAFDGAALARPFVYQFSTLPEDPMDTTLEAAPKGDLFCKAEDCTNTCAASATVTSCQAGCPASCDAECMCMESDAACKEMCNTCMDCEASCLRTCTANCPASILTSFSACAFGGCHFNNVDSAGVVQAGAAMGLDLSTNVGVAMTAINRVALQTQQGEHADEPDRSPVRFGRAMPIIDANNPGNSYLLYKLAVGKSATGEAAVDPAEIDRLRATLVVGMPMPIPPGAGLRDVDLAAITAWIAQGAPTPACQ